MWSKLDADGVTDSEYPFTRGNGIVGGYDDKLITYGGYSASVYYDVWEFDLRLKQWKQWVVSGHRPPVRIRMSGEVAGHHMFIYGGYDNEYTQTGAKQRDGDVDMLNLLSKEWTRKGEDGF